MSRTRELAEAVCGIEFDALAEPEIEAVRRLLLDHLGVAAAGSVTDSATTFRRTMDRFAHDASAALPVIGAGVTAAPVPAAMANAVAGHSIEYDDVHNSSSSHPGVVMYPAAMAATALAGGDERDLVRAVVIGFEVMCRAGRAADPASHYARHFHPTGTIGSLGAAAAASAALGLDAGGINSAIGIAATMASGSMEFLRDGAWTKRLHPALAARNGVEAGLLAADGYVGTDDGICGERGFLASHSDAPEPERLMEGWGRWPLEVVSTSIKRHTCCRYNQGAIDALLAIRSDHGVGAGDVESVVIGIPSVAVDIVAEPAASKRRPASVVDAQFSLAFGAAAALLWGRAGLAEYDEARLSDPAALARHGPGGLRGRSRDRPRLPRQVAGLGPGHHPQRRRPHPAGRRSQGRPRQPVHRRRVPREVRRPRLSRLQLRGPRRHRRARPVNRSPRLLESPPRQSDLTTPR